MFARRMQTVIANPVKPLGQNMLYHTANKSLHGQVRYLTLAALVVAIPIPHALPIITQEAPKRDRRAHHILGEVVSEALSSSRNLTVFPMDWWRIWRKGRSLLVDKASLTTSPSTWWARRSRFGASWVMMDSACGIGTATTRAASVKWRSCRCSDLLAAWCSIFCPRGFTGFGITVCMRRANINEWSRYWKRSGWRWVGPSRGRIGWWGARATKSGCWPARAVIRCVALVVAARWCFGRYGIRVMGWSMTSWNRLSEDATTLEGLCCEGTMWLERGEPCGDQLGWSFIGMGEAIEAIMMGALGVSSHPCCDDVKYPSTIKSPPEGR